MDSTASPVKRDFSSLYFLAARLAGMVLVAGALPVAHATVSENYSGDGQQGFGFLIMFMVVGLGAAFIYLIAASLAYFIVRKKSLRTRLRIEVSILLVFVLTSIYGGVTSHYS